MADSGENPSSLPPPAPRPPLWLRIALAASFALIALYALECMYYVLGTTLGGHGESSVVCTAFVFSQGHPLYPAPDAPERYAMVYGPMQAAFNAALFWLFGAHLTPIRLAGALLAFAGLAACWKTFNKIGTRHAAALGMGWLALVYLKYTLITYYIRPDTPLQLCISLCLLATFMRTRWSWLLLALALAWGFNLKITMLVYALPILPLFIKRHGFASLCSACLLAALLAMAPFIFFPQVSAHNYFQVLTTAVDEGTESTMIIPVGGYLGLLSLPPLAVIALFALQNPAAFKSLVHRYRWFAGFSTIALFAVLRITGKPGAGPSHLLPLFPILGIVAVKCLGELLRAPSPFQHKKLSTTLIITATLFLLTTAAWDIYDAYTEIYQAYRWDKGDAWVAEIETLADGYPDQTISMGVGSTRENYASFSYQPYLVIRGNPYLLDVPAMMDMQKAGRQIPASTHIMITKGVCPIWLIPRGEAPFELLNWYEPHGMIFDDAFRRLFHQHYKIIDHSAHFDVWAFQK